MLLAAACLITTRGALAATQPSRQGADPAKAAVLSSDPRWVELGHTRWIADGRDDAPRKVYVFTDPNCPYCTKPWSDARPWVESGRVQLRHVIVGVLTATSEGKAAAILGDKDPVAKLAAYEGSHAFAVASMLESGRPHPVEDASMKPLSPIPAGLQTDLDGNQRIMASLGIRATPGIASIGADGKVAARQALRPQDLVGVFGPR
jgi:thiol:disulfide interchange protein DsbG